MKRFLHSLSELLHVPQSWRNSSVALWKRLTHWKPKYYRCAKSFGLNSISHRDVKVTISLTTYPARIKTVHETINTLLVQTVKPDRVVLWLANTQFPRKEDDLPRRLLKLKKYGLSIEWCEDLKSFKKLVPSLKAYPDDIVITVDDDILYDQTLVERLLNSYKGNPNCIHTQLAMKVDYLGEGRFTSYNSWRYDKQFHATYLNLLLGGSGTLYPPHSLSDEVIKSDVFMEIAPSVDDIWFWSMAVLAGTKIMHIVDGTERHLVQNPVASNKYALWNTNRDVLVGNDVQLREIVQRYPNIQRRLDSEIRYSN